MANYPAQDPSFTIKQDGVDYPQAAHINDLQAEVAAIGSALRGTLQHNVAATGGLSIAGGSTLTTLQAGASTVASLQVSGDSTFAGTVTFAGGVTMPDPVTFSSGASISTGVIRQNALPAFSVYHSTFVALNSGSSQQGVTFDAQEFVQGDIGHSTSADSSRVTINTTGLYHLTCHGLAASGSNPRVHLRVLFNDTSVLLHATEVFQTGEPWHFLTVSRPIRIASTGYLTVRMTSSNSANSTWGSSDASLAMRLSGVFLG